jgi:hypothetical protein
MCNTRKHTYLSPCTCTHKQTCTCITLPQHTGTFSGLLLQWLALGLALSHLRQNLLHWSSQAYPTHTLTPENCGLISRALASRCHRSTAALAYRNAFCLRMACWKSSQLPIPSPPSCSEKAWFDSAELICPSGKSVCHILAKERPTLPKASRF